MQDQKPLNYYKKIKGKCLRTLVWEKIFVFDKTSETEAREANMDKWNSTELKSFYTAKETVTS